MSQSLEQGIVLESYLITKKELWWMASGHTNDSKEQHYKIKNQSRRILDWFFAIWLMLSSYPIFVIIR